MPEIESYLPLLRSVVRSVVRNQRMADPEELEAEGLILIWQILKDWKEERGEPAGYLRSSLHRRFSAYLEEQAGRIPSLAAEPVSREESIPLPERTYCPLQEMYLRCLKSNGRRFASRRLRVQIPKTGRKE